ncbi:MAG: hypothetical protein NTW21_28890 [Verrucomicrobia bacterium]|nr:hypothetical protein [Verrucomicrobiota bacterium]
MNNLILHPLLAISMTLLAVVRWSSGTASTTTRSGIRKTASA